MPRRSMVLPLLLDHGLAALKGSGALILGADGKISAITPIMPRR